MSNDHRSVWVGFDLGGTKMLTAAYDGDWQEIGRRRRKTKGRAGSDSGIKRIISTIDRLLEDSDLDKASLAGIGIGCPGPIDMDQGKVLMTPNLGWGDLNIRDQLNHYFDCPVVVMNDVDAGIYAEYRFGAAENAHCAVGLFPGTGVGGGCVHEGRILQGAGISCMEIGHTRISSTNCIDRTHLSGTVESEASRLAIASEACKLAYRGEAPYLAAEYGTDLSSVRSGALADSIDHGDQGVKELVIQACETIGFAVANLVHLLAPDKVILGGGLVEAMEDLVVETVRETAEKNVLEVYHGRFEVIAAKLGDDAGVRGAAAWAKKNLS